MSTTRYQIRQDYKGGWWWSLNGPHKILSEANDGPYTTLLNCMKGIRAFQKRTRKAPIEVISTPKRHKNEQSRTLSRNRRSNRPRRNSRRSQGK